MKIKDFKKGFTLIELMIVITVIAILAGIVLFGLGQAQARARDVQRQQIVKAVQNYLQAYASDNNGSYPPAGVWNTLFAGWTTNCPSAGSNGPLCSYATAATVPTLNDPGCGTGDGNGAAEVRNLLATGTCNGRVIYTYATGGTYTGGDANKCNGALYALSVTQEGGGISWFCAPR